MTDPPPPADEVDQAGWTRAVFSSIGALAQGFGRANNVTQLRANKTGRLDNSSSKTPH
jgi:hypothetical protein